MGLRGALLVAIVGAVVLSAIFSDPRPISNNDNSVTRRTTLTNEKSHDKAMSTMLQETQPLTRLPGETSAVTPSKPSVYVNPSETVPDCLKADTASTQRLLVERKGKLPLPILNMGMPKIGSMTLHWFMRCAGIRSQHNGEGTCFKEASEQGLSLFASCSGASCFFRKRRAQIKYNRTFVGKCRNFTRVEAWMQMDIENPPKACFFPQVSLVEQIHQQAPNATFIMNFRPFADWYRSMAHHGRMHNRLKNCDLPGLPPGKGNFTELKDWLCGHVQNIRNFVKAHPSHALIELDLYDTTRTSQVMAQLFHTSETCWGQHNQNNKIHKEAAVSQ